MIDATKRWLRRNRTTFALGAGVIGVGYIAGQYVISKIAESRERMISERVAKEKYEMSMRYDAEAKWFRRSLRRRFQQNQEDCTITVLELLPTITENVLTAQPTEKITQELQMKKAQRLGKTAATSDLAASEPSISAKSGLDDDRGSLSSESYIHANPTASSSSVDEDTKSNRSKAELWHDLKISSLTRAFTLVYVISLLSLLTRIQLNLLGRRSYLASVVAQASSNSQNQTINLEDHAEDSRHPPDGDEYETNRQYLTFSWWLLHKGWKDVMKMVASAVDEVFGPVKPTADVRAEQFSALVLELRKRVEGDSAKDRSDRSWLSTLLPPPNEEMQVLHESGMMSSSYADANDSTASGPSSEVLLGRSLRRLLDETADVLESPLFHDLLTHLLDACFSRLVDDVIGKELFNPASGSQNPNTTGFIQTPAETSQKPVRLASILAVITKEAHQIGRGSPNEYVQTLETVEDLDAFAAVIYSSNFETDHEHFRSSMESPPDDESLRELSDHAPQEASPTMVDKVANLADTAWTGFESVWAKVAG